MTDALQFLELSLPAATIRESLAWYTRLGFTEHETRDVRDYHYAVVSAGDICIGLHGEGLMAAGLSFVRPELARYVRSQAATGREFEFVAIGEDQFHELRLADPDGTLAIMLEARTFFPATLSTEASLCTGPVDRLRLPCVNLEESIDFWQDAGFIVVQAEIQGCAELHAPGLTVELREGTRDIALLFLPNDLDQCLRAIEASETPIRATSEGYELRAPEGTRLIIQDLPRN